MNREIIKIDEDKCNGCGLCISACAEGALQLVDGKAKLVADIYCDGLGACIGDCPEGALEIIERDAPEFDEKAVEELLAKQKKAPATETRQDAAPACGCPGSAALALNNQATDDDAEPGKVASRLGHWPIKIQLLRPDAPFLHDADLVLLADCAGVAHPNLHTTLLKDKAIAIGCPKLDDLDAHIDRLTQILGQSKPKSLSVVVMEVPCCQGLMHAARQAIENSGYMPKLKQIIVGRNGEIQREIEFEKA